MSSMPYTPTTDPEILATMEALSAEEALVEDLEAAPYPYPYLPYRKHSKVSRLRRRADRLWTHAQRLYNDGDDGYRAAVKRAERVEERIEAVRQAGGGIWADPGGTLVSMLIVAMVAKAVHDTWETSQRRRRRRSRRLPA